MPLPSFLFGVETNLEESDTVQAFQAACPAPPTTRPLAPHLHAKGWGCQLTD